MKVGGDKEWGNIYVEFTLLVRRSHDKSITLKFGKRSKHKANIEAALILPSQFRIGVCIYVYTEYRRMARFISLTELRVARRVLNLGTKLRSVVSLMHW
jgi:hypothetical protein